MSRLALGSRIRKAENVSKQRIGEVYSVYLDEEWQVILRVEHAIEDHASNFRRNHILSNSELDLLVHVVWQEPQQIVVDTIEILSVLPRVVQSLLGDLRKLTASQEPTRDKRIDWRKIALPICMRRLVSLLWLTIVEESFVIAVPSV